MNPRKSAERELNDAGFRFLRRGGDHDIWIDPTTRELIPLSRSSHFDESDLKMVRSEIRTIIRHKEGI